MDNLKSHITQSNRWIPLELNSLEESFTLMNKARPNTLTLLPKDEVLFSKCTQILSKLFDNKEKVNFENLKITEGVEKIQDKFIRVSSRFLFISFPVYYFLITFSTKP